MSKDKVVIWGASGHAKVIADIIRLNDEYEIAGFLDDFATDKYNTDFCGSTILGGREQLKLLCKNGIDKIVMGFGECAPRLDLALEAISFGFSLINSIHPLSVVAKDVKMGSGVVVVAGAIINPGTTIGDNVIINTNASVDHDCIIGNGVHICPGVSLAGRVSVGQGTWIGIGSCVKDKINIGEFSMIGAGSVVVKDIPSGVVAYGAPARVIRENSK
jgi:acetyltransferase EpsM